MLPKLKVATAFASTFLVGVLIGTVILQNHQLIVAKGSDIIETGGRKNDELDETKTIFKVVSRSTNRHSSLNQDVRKKAHYILQSNNADPELKKLAERILTGH